MFGIPLWAWIVTVFVVLLFIGYRILIGLLSSAFRQRARNYLLAVLQTLDPETESGEESGARLKAKFGGRSIDLDLEPFYAAMTEATFPYQEQVATLRFLADALPAGATRLTLRDHGPRILPKLIDADDLEAREAVFPLPSHPFGTTGLHTIYMLDGEWVALAITDQHRQELGLALDELADLASENLMDPMIEDAMTTVLSQREAVTFQLDDGYNVARLLTLQRRLPDDASLISVILDPNCCLIAPMPSSAEEHDRYLTAGEQAVEEEPWLSAPVIITRSDATLMAAQA